MKRKNLLTFLIAACLSLCVLGGLSANRMVKANAAATVQETSVTQIVVDNGGIWIGLSDTDYGNKQSYNNADYSPLKTLNTLNKIKIDGNYIANDNSEIGPSGKGKGDPYINLFNKLPGSFRLSNTPKSQVVIEKGCQFPSYDYWNGNADGVIYEVNETVTFNKTGDTWVKAMPETDISNTFAAAISNTDRDSVIISLTTTADISAPDSKWLMDNMTEIQNYITVNGKTVVEINTETDDSSYTYIEFPGDHGGVYAVPVRVCFTKSGEKAEFRIHIHNDYFATLPASFAVGVKAGFVRANTAATTNMTVKTDVSLKKIGNSFIDADIATANANIVLSDGLQGSAFDTTEGYYHAYAYTDLFKGNADKIGYGIIDNSTYNYIADYVYVNGQSVSEINKNTDITGWEWAGFPYSVGETYRVPVMLYVNATDEANASKGETRLELRIHKNYIDLLDGDITVTIKKDLAIYNSANNIVYNVNNDVSEVIYYKSYSLTINVEGQDPTVLDIKHTSALDLSGFCPAKEGYTFSGWYTDAELTTEATETTMPASDYAVYGKYTAIEYTATVTLVNGTHTITYTIENRAEKLAEAKALLGKDDAQYAYSDNLPAELPLENGKTYSETRTVKEYDVKIGDEGAVKTPYGSKITKPATDPVKTEEGYTFTFKGWYNGETEWDFENDVVTGDVTLTVKFDKTINKYTVTITFVGIEKAPVTLTVEYNNAVDLTVYAENGYDFTVTCGDDEITKLVVKGDVALTITYTEKTPEESGSESEKESESDTSAVESGDSGSASGCFGSVKSAISVTAFLGLAALVVLIKKKNN